MSQLSQLAKRTRSALAASLPSSALFRCSRALSSASGPYDVVVVGGGPGGYVAAIKSSQLGMKTAVVESRGKLGGTCLNVGCIPSKDATKMFAFEHGTRRNTLNSLIGLTRQMDFLKHEIHQEPCGGDTVGGEAAGGTLNKDQLEALLHSSHLYHEATHNMASNGINVGDVSIDVGKMMESKKGKVEALTGGIEYLCKKYKVDYVKGFGKLGGPKTVNVDLTDGGVQTLESKNILIATGSEVSPLPPVPVDNAQGKIVDSTGALELKEVPKSMVLIGGGVIGLEMGSVWSRLGANVTVVEFLDRVCPSMDKELTTAFTRVLKKQGLKFKFKTKVTSSEVTESGVKLTMEPSAGGDSTTIDADVVLVATGRRPYTANLGCDELGIVMDKMGRIEVDSHFRTAVPSIYAIGDCIAGPMLAHKAEEEGIACVESIAGFAGHVNYDAIPGVVYTHPEVAEVGKTEEALKEAGIAYNKGVFPFSANSRAACVGDKDGMVKILSDKETDRILGAHIMGPNAGEMIAEVVLGMEYGASSEDIARTCHAHPTLSEALKEACMAAYDKPIHF